MNTIKALTVFLIFGVSTNVFASQYTAVLSCQMQGRNVVLQACFKDTDLKIVTPNSAQIYKVYNLTQAGNMEYDGLHIGLPTHFQLTAQNSDQYLVLAIKIYDSGRHVVYQDVEGQYGVIKVGN